MLTIFVLIGIIISFLVSAILGKEGENTNLPLAPERDIYKHEEDHETPRFSKAFEIDTLPFA